MKSDFIEVFSRNELSSFMEPDLFIINKKKSYGINSFVASTKSKYIYDLITEDISIDTIHTHFDTSHLIPIIQFLNGKQADLSKPDEDHLKIAIFFSIQTLVDSIFVDIGKSYTNSKLIKLIYKMYKNKLNLSNAIAFLCCKQVENTISGPELKDLLDYPLDFICIFLQNPYFEVKDSEKTEYMLNILNKDKSAIKILKYFDLVDLSNPELRKIVSNPQTNINYLRKSLLTPSISSKIKFTTLRFDYNPDSPNNGILHSQVKFTISASEFHPNHGPECVLAYDDSYYCSTTGPLAYILFDFTPATIEPVGVLLRSWAHGSNKVVPNTIRVSVGFQSQELKSYIIRLKEQLLGDKKMYYVEFPKNIEMCSMIQIEQTECLHPVKQVFALSFVEFFGKISLIEH